jgi:hypothetical protein
MAKRSTTASDRFGVDELSKLLAGQDAAMKELFAKAINMYVSPGAEELADREKEDQLKKAIEDSLKGGRS